VASTRAAHATAIGITFVLWWQASTSWCEFSCSLYSDFSSALRGSRHLLPSRSSWNFVAGRRPLNFWSAELTHKPRRRGRQLQRINLVAFQAPVRPGRLVVSRRHQHHQVAAVPASLRSIGLTHAAM
jgi:hypothetical protein